MQGRRDHRSGRDASLVQGSERSVFVLRSQSAVARCPIIPIVYEGKVIGAIGVSGNTPQEDEDIAKVGAAAAAAAIQGGEK
ncbi:MAG TPA: heme-binding protein [Blastocatellia bacterium]|nr:heme-binding protein [Blastocatellia bacterium]